MCVPRSIDPSRKWRAAHFEGHHVGTIHERVPLPDIVVSGLHLLENCVGLILAPNATQRTRNPPCGQNVPAVEQFDKQGTCIPQTAQDNLRFHCVGAVEYFGDVDECRFNRENEQPIFCDDVALRRQVLLEIVQRRVERQHRVVARPLGSPNDHLLRNVGAFGVQK